MEYPSLTAIVFIGIQASGKSTFYQENFKSTYIHINLDTLHTRNKENLLMEECAKTQKSFVVDNTNPTILERKKYLEFAKNQGYYKVGYYFQSVLEDCLKRNELRVNKAYIPINGILATSNKLELPSYKEGFDKLYYVRIIDQHFSIEDWSEEVEF